MSMIFLPIKFGSGHQSWLLHSAPIWFGFWRESSLFWPFDNPTPSTLYLIIHQSCLVCQQNRKEMVVSLYLLTYLYFIIADVITLSDIYYLIILCYNLFYSALSPPSSTLWLSWFSSIFVSLLELYFSTGSRENKTWSSV